MQLLDGKIARAHYTDLLKSKISSSSVILHLVIIQVGNRPDSDAFIRSKKAFAQKIGARETHIQLPLESTQEEVQEKIRNANIDTSVHGIIVQLPLPPHMNPDVIVETIDPLKDVDGLTSSTKFRAATARGIQELLDFYNISIKGKKVTVFGRSKLVGKPIADMCMKQGASVTVCSRETEGNLEKARTSDILIVAIGQPLFINKDFIHDGHIVIDVGITRVNDALVGDVDFNAVKDSVSMITPVPGGVGQMTVLALFENLYDAWYTRVHIIK